MMTNTEYEGAHSGLCTEIQCQEDRLVQYNAGTTESLGRLFGDLTNCTIESLTVNVRPIFNVQSAEKVDKEFDELVHMQILTIDCCMEYNYCIECLFYYNFCDRELYIFPS